MSIQSNCFKKVHRFFKIVFVTLQNSSQLLFLFSLFFSPQVDGNTAVYYDLGIHLFYMQSITANFHTIRTRITPHTDTFLRRASRQIISDYFFN